VYVYSGTVVPGDIGSGTPPLTTAPVTQDNAFARSAINSRGWRRYVYRGVHQPGGKRHASPETIAFLGTAQVTVGAGAEPFTISRLQPGYCRSGRRVPLIGPSDAAAVAQDGDVIEIDAGRISQRQRRLEE